MSETPKQTGSYAQALPICTLTMNPCIDKSTRIENVFPERKLRCGRPRYEPGGGGINVSRAICKLGGRSLALYIGGGATADRMDGLLDQEKVLHERVPSENTIRENLIVYEESSEQQYRFGMPGPELSGEVWKGSLQRIASMAPHVQYIVASGSLPPGVPEDFYGRLARLAGKMGVRLILDTSGNPLRAAVDEGVYMIKPNIRELKALTGEDVEEDSHQTAAARQIIEKGKSAAVVISLGGSGARLVSRKECRRIHAPTVPIRSKVGAGDSMVGGMVLALHRGEILPDAVRFGIAAGSAAVMTPGTELCRKEDTEKLYKNMIENPEQ
jgi:6-phosphofructokinase 2